MRLISKLTFFLFCSICISLGCSEEKKPVCGNGKLEAGERCDDGNEVNDDACSNQCLPAECGDGIVQGVLGEECDDANHVNFDLCTNACRSARCGDGILQQVEASEATPTGDGGMADVEPAVVAEYIEACDDGNLDSSDGCTAECQVARCGDGVVQLGVEACDDGNDSDEDGCTTTCQLSTCGDGIVQPGEACDDGNLNDNDECRNNCNLARCGDGVVQPRSKPVMMATVMIQTFARVPANSLVMDGFEQAGAEAYDDGNDVDDDACRNNCERPRCSDGVQQAGEECDDGNTLQTDACTNDCRTARCGGGYVQADVELR